MLCTGRWHVEGGHFAERGKELEAAPHYRPRPLSFSNVKKAKSKPAPRARARVSGLRREPWEGAQPRALPGKPQKQLDTQKARAGRQSGAQRGAWREGADYLQAAGWQCPLLAAPACCRDNAAEQSRGSPAPSPWREGAQAGGERRGRLLGGMSGHSSDPHPGAPVTLQTPGPQKLTELLIYEKGLKQAFNS